MIYGVYLWVEKYEAWILQRTATSLAQAEADQDTQIGILITLGEHPDDARAFTGIRVFTDLIPHTIKTDEWAAIF